MIDCKLFIARGLSAEVAVGNAISDCSPGIVAGYLRNTIEHNQIEASAIGIRFENNGYYTNNRVGGATTPYDLNGFTPTDGGGNISY